MAVATFLKTARAEIAVATRVETVAIALTHADERTAVTEETPVTAGTPEIEIVMTATAVETVAGAVMTDAGAVATTHGIGAVSARLCVTRENAARSKTDAPRAVAALRIATRKRATTSAAELLLRNNF